MQRQAGRRAGLEGLGATAAGADADAGGGGDVGGQQVGQVGQRVADSGHLPVEDADDARLRLVEDDVVDLVVAVHEGAAVARLRASVREEGHHVVVVRNLADRLVAVDVARLGLRFRDRGEGRELPVEEAGRLAKVGHVDVARFDAMEFGQRADGVVPPGGALACLYNYVHCILSEHVAQVPVVLDRPAHSLYVHLRPVLDAHVGQARILKDAPIQELHDVERGADDGVIFAQAVRLRYRHVRFGERGNDAVLAVDLVRRLREQLARGLLAQHKLGAGGRGCQEVGWIGLTIAKLDENSVPCHTLHTRKPWWSIGKGKAHTCLTSIGVLISGTFASMYLDRAATSMGWRTSPAMLSAFFFFLVYIFRSSVAMWSARCLPSKGPASCLFDLAAEACSVVSGGGSLDQPSCRGSFAGCSEKAKKTGALHTWSQP